MGVELIIISSLVFKKTKNKENNYTYFASIINGINLSMPNFFSTYISIFFKINKNKFSVYGKCHFTARISEH
jgi:hypothetical protein